MAPPQTPPTPLQALSVELATAGVPSLSLNPITAANCLKVLRQVLQRQGSSLAEEQVGGGGWGGGQAHVLQGSGLDARYSMPLANFLTQATQGLDLDCCTPV